MDTQFTNEDLKFPPGVIDQMILFENTLFATQPDGTLVFKPQTSSYTETGAPIPQAVLIDPRGLINIVQMKIYEFFIPKFDLWDNITLAYQNRITLTINEINNNGFIGLQLNAGNNLYSYNFQFEFKLTDLGDRYQLTPIEDTLNFKNVLNFTSGNLTFVFKSLIAQLPMPDPYLPNIYNQVSPTVTVNFYNQVGGIYVATFTTSAPHNFYTNSYIELLSLAVPTTSGAYGVLILNQPYSIIVTGVTTFYITINVSTGETGTFNCSIFNLSWQIRIPIRFRQLEKLSTSSNRMVSVVD